MGIIAGIRSALQAGGAKIINWINIRHASDRTITIYEPYTHTGNVLKNRLWYRGDPAELDQYYKAAGGNNDPTNAARFWAAVPSDGLQIRKIHTGIPSMCVDKIADIVTSDMEAITFSAPNDPAAARWLTIQEGNDFTQLVNDAIVNTDVDGDGAFRVKIDPAVDYPVLDFSSGAEVDYTRQGKQITEVLFYSDWQNAGGVPYRLEEVYGVGYIRYNLYDTTGAAVPLGKVPELADLQPVTWAGKYMLAVPMRFKRSPKFTGRGCSLFDAKCDEYDSLDEVVSQWTDAVRAGRTAKYIPEDLVPKDPKTGRPISPNPFDNQFIRTVGDMAEGENGKIQVTQPTIASDGYLQKYITDLDLCLQGVLSPSTLGIDNKKLDNAEAQREKEKTTLYSRAKRVEVLEKVIPRVVAAALRADDLYHNRPGGDYPCTVAWGEYANPSFEAVVETVGKARTTGVMSVEAGVEEMWGDAKDAAWKTAEVARIKAEQGVVQKSEPSAGDTGGLEDGES